MYHNYNVFCVPVEYFLVFEGERFLWAVPLPIIRLTFNSLCAKFLDRGQKSTIKSER